MKERWLRTWVPGRLSGFDDPPKRQFQVGESLDELVSCHADTEDVEYFRLPEPENASAVSEARFRCRSHRHKAELEGIASKIEALCERREQLLHGDGGD